MISVRRISMQDPLYQAERELRNEVLLRPIGLPDFGWEKRDTDAHHFVALRDGKVVGCVLLCSTGQFIQMAVHASLQGQGVGKLLMESVFTQARELGFKEVFCHARENAIRFYEGVGLVCRGDFFEEVGIRHKIMARKLGSS